MPVKGGVRRQSNLTWLDGPKTRGIFYRHPKHPEERGGSVDQ